MSSTTGILIFIATLFVMIIVHETGHFLAARAFGIKVEEFFIGFGPKIFSWRRGETEYGLKAILLGGYVRIAGMNPWQPISDEERPRTFGAKPAWQRAIVLAAGSFTHLIMGFIILSITLGVVGIPVGTSTTVSVVEPVVEGARGPAAAAGLKPGDRVVAADGMEVKTWDDFRKVVRSSPGKTIPLVVGRDGRQLTLSVTPAAGKDPEGGKDKVGIVGIRPVPVKQRTPFPGAIVEGAKATWNTTRLSVSSIGKVFSPNGVKKVVESLGGKGDRGIDEPMGLVGGARQAGILAEDGDISYLLQMLAGFIIFVGVINMVPLPPLDGGHLVVLMIEKIRGRPVDMKKVVPVAAVVLGFLVLFTVALLYLDIVRPITSPF